MASQSRRITKERPPPPQPPPPPRGNPTIESWLDQVPSTTAKLTPEELRQWELDEAGHSGRAWFIISIALRVLSLVSAFIIAVIGLHLLPSFYDSDQYRLTPIIVPGVGLTVWNAVEFLVVAMRRSHRGMPRRVHLPADGLICLILAASIAGFWLGLYDDGYWYISGPAWWYTYRPNTVQYIVAFVFLVVLLLIHAVFFFFLLCSRQFRKDPRVPTPRIMYLPDTGEAVVVLARPYPPEPSHQQQRKPLPPPTVELGRLPATDGVTNLQSPTPVHPKSVIEAQLTESPTGEAVQGLSIDLDNGRNRPSMPPVLARKPLPGSKSMGTHYATPWPPDHIPDEAEQARAARGESQAQWMTLAGSSLDLKRGNLGTDDSAREGEKSDLFRGLHVSAVRKP